MKIENLWPTPIGVFEEKLSEECTAYLIDLIRERENMKKRFKGEALSFKEQVDSGSFYNNSNYNLFDIAEDSVYYKSIKEFEEFSCRKIREYIREAFGADDWETVELSGRCFGHVAYSQHRTFPHYHQSSDLVLLHYLNIEETKTPLSLILLEPRGAPNYPWWGKMHVINPVSGTNVCHQSFVWHETNHWSGTSTRELIGVNFKVLGHGNETLFKRTSF